MTTINVVFFKPTGKYYTSEKVPVRFKPLNGTAREDFRKALKDFLQPGQYQGMMAVTTDEKAPFPLMEVVQ